jgi:hypothetical protein
MIAQYNEITGDVTKARENESGNILIPHVCNNLGKYGAGVALAIRNKWLPAYTSYLNHLESLRDKGMVPSEFLGETDSVFVEDDVLVVNMIAQHRTISAVNPRPLKYDALVDCMRKIARMHRICLPDERFKICCPKFGSALAGGNWDFIKLLIEDIWLSAGIDVTVYNY